MSVPVRAHGRSHIGLVHEKNEDQWCVHATGEGGLLLLVCDGMGGMGRGDQASAFAVARLTEAIDRPGQGAFPPPRLRAALRDVDVQLREALCAGHDGHPGSTAALTYLIDGAAFVAWVGDSRCYLIRDHRVVERTLDHKLVAELVRAGQLTPEEAQKSPLAHVVTRSLGGRSPDEAAVRPDALEQPWKLAHGDVLLVCSDGLTDLVDDAEIGAIVGDLAPDIATERLVELALERGGHDNITCIVARWDGATYREEDAATPLIQPTRDSWPDVRHRVDLPLVEADDSRVTEEIDLHEPPPPSPPPAMVATTASGAPTHAPGAPWLLALLLALGILLAWFASAAP